MSSSPTIKEVAAKSGVGIGTVSRVLNNSPQISEATRKKVMDAIKELNYVPNVAGKRLSQNKSYVIAVVIPVIDHPFFAKLVACIEKEADERGYSLLLATSQHRIEKEYEILRRLQQNEADGALFVTHYEHAEEDFKNLAIVSIDRHLGKGIPIVTTDNYEASKKAVEYLIEKGCKRIAYLGTKPNQVSEVSLREQAYVDAMKEHKMECIIVNKNVGHGEENQLIDELFESHKGFDGVFVSGCTLATLLYNRIKALNLKTPEDIEMVSYDGEFALDDVHHITTLEQPLDKMAKKCVELLINKIGGVETEPLSKFNCRFVKGETTK